MADKPPIADMAWAFLGLFMLAILACVVGLLYLFLVHFWIPITLLGLVGVGIWLVQFSPFGLELKAQARTRVLLFRLGSVDMRDFPGADFFGRDIAKTLATQYDLDPVVAAVIEDVAGRLYFREGFEARYIGEAPGEASSIEGARFRETVQALIKRLSDPAVIATFREAVSEALSAFASALPPRSPRSAYLSFEVPLAAVARNLPTLLTECVLPFYSEAARNHRLFVDLRAQLDRNLHEVSSVPLDQKDSPRLVLPERYKGNRIVPDYLENTPLLSLFEAPATISIPDERRFEHMHIVAGTGHGKTQTLQRLILGDLSTDAGLVVIDSQGEMLRKIQGIDADKEIIYIDPTDLERPPALNMFDVSRLDGLPEVKREQFLNGLIELLEYVFAGLLKAELTQKQNVLFRYTLRLMLAVPGATMLDLVKFLSDPAPYLIHAKSLNPMAQEFFTQEFHQKSYQQTREQIRRRLYGVLENDSFRRMFSAPTNDLSLPEAMNRGAVVLVDTAKSHLKADASSLMGRYFIALTLQAALEREGYRNPAFLYIDEAGEYFDDNIDSLLNEARKRRVGIVMAHQYLDQLTPQLRASIATNTAIKMAGGVSDRDARTLAADMRCDPQLIISQTTGHFACYIKGVTAQAVSVAVPFGELEAQPTRPLALPPPVPEVATAETVVAPESEVDGAVASQSKAPRPRLPPPVQLVVPPKPTRNSSSSRGTSPRSNDTSSGASSPNDSDREADQKTAEISPTTDW